MTPEQEAALEDALAMPWSVRTWTHPDEFGVFFYWAETPELFACVAVADSEERARAKLAEVRREELTALIDNDNPIPSPLGG